MPPSLDQIFARIRATAGRVACTEDRVAATFEYIAQHKPEAAERLTVEASHARQFAARLRQVSIHPGQKSTYL